MKSRRAQPLSTAEAAPLPTVVNARARFLARTMGAMTEEAIHRAVVQHIERRRAPGTVWWHTPNGDIRHRGAAGRLKAMGTRAGIPDLLLFRGGQLYGLELKRIGGRLSAAQDERQRELAAAGAIIATVEGLDGALRALEAWGLIR